MITLSQNLSFIDNFYQVLKKDELKKSGKTLLDPDAQFKAR
jgi:hypothetical protein